MARNTQDSGLSTQDCLCASIATTRSSFNSESTRCSGASWRLSSSSPARSGSSRACRRRSTAGFPRRTRCGRSRSRPKRGLIMDREGKILADNQPAYTLQIDRVVMKPLLKADAERRAKLIAFLSQILQRPPAEVLVRWERESKKARLHPALPPRRRPLDVAGRRGAGTVDRVPRGQRRAGPAPELSVRHDGRARPRLHRRSRRERDEAERRPRAGRPDREARGGADVRPVPARPRRRGVLGVRRGRTPPQ